jgi:lipopolysaccharide export system permease protein
MGSIGRYIFRTTFGAFLIVLASLTGVIWVTQALRDIDIITNQGQTLLVFVGITGLAIPLLVLVIAPLALVVAVVHVLNKLSTDSELIVMNASGMSPWLLFRSFLAVAAVVSLIVAVTGAYLAPKGMRELRNWIMQVRADLVTNIVQPGRFTTLERGLTFHIRERRSDGLLLGIFVDDRRDPKEQISILAEQGTLVKNETGTFLVLENGNVQRKEANQRDPAVVSFERYAFDLSQFSGGPQTRQLAVRERYLWDLIAPDRNDPLYKAQASQFWAEMNDRIAAILYPLTFVIVTYAYLGAPRTNRQSRGLSMASAIVAVLALRLGGFACSVFAVHYASAAFVQYAILAVTMALGLSAIARGVIIEPPAFINHAVAAISERFARRAMAT